MLPSSTESIYALYRQSKCRLTTDSRSIEPGAIFLCLRGASFNGNLFAAEALQKGASYAIADDPSVCNDDRILLVEDTLQTLQQLAAMHRNQAGIEFLAIGGSNGKTTSKELCAAVLGSKYRTLATKGNLNNHIGVPLTILSLSGAEEKAIIELGTNHPGEMKVLCDMVNADSGIVTNVGKEHLEGFGSLEEVATEETELYRNLKRNSGLAIVNADDPWLASSADLPQKQFSYGIQHKADLQGIIESAMPLLRFHLQYQAQTFGPFEAQIGGTYNLYNILAAVSAGVISGIPVETAAKAACAYQPGNNRSEWRQTAKYRIWLDAYNANPSSMELALKEIAAMPGKRFALLGDMLELGSHSQSEHKAILNLAENLGLDGLFTSGPEFRQASGNAGFAFENTAKLIEYLRQNPIPVGTLLIKGSRGMKMESLLEILN